MDTLVVSMVVYSFEFEENIIDVLISKPKLHNDVNSYVNFPKMRIPLLISCARYTKFSKMFQKMFF